MTRQTIKPPTLPPMIRRFSPEMDVSKILSSGVRKAGINTCQRDARELARAVAGDDRPARKPFNQNQNQQHESSTHVGG